MEVVMIDFRAGRPGSRLTRIIAMKTRKIDFRAGRAASRTGSRAAVQDPELLLFVWVALADSEWWWWSRYAWSPWSRYTRHGG
jgi:hypothetical protein